MIKGLIFDIGDIIYTHPYHYKELSPVLMMFKVEPLLLKLSSFLLKIKKSKKEYTKKEMSKLKSKFKIKQGVKETLKKLKQKKMKIIFLTDAISSPHVIKKRVEAVDVHKYVDGIVHSAELGFHKPHKQAYDAAIKATGAKNNQVLFVGHAKDELDGAKRAGLRTIGYNLDPGAKADFYAENFSDILKIVGELNAKRRDN